MPGNNRGRGGSVVKKLRETDGQAKSLGRAQFTLTAGTANERSLVASVKADVPFAVREGVAARISFVTAEEFTTDATAGTAETFNLAHDIVKTDNATPFVLYDDGAVVQADSVDYAANSFTYTDGATGSTLHAFYVARDPGAVTVEKVAPKTGSAISEDLHEDTTSGLADRNQNKEPVMMDFGHPLESVVPTNWKLNVYVDAPFAVRWDDSPLTTTNGDTATNAVLNIPIHQFEQDVPGLENAVKAQAIGLEG